MPRPRCRAKTPCKKPDPHERIRFDASCSARCAIRLSAPAAADQKLCPFGLRDSRGRRRVCPFGTRLNGILQRCSAAGREGSVLAASAYWVFASVILTARARYDNRFFNPGPIVPGAFRLFVPSVSPAPYTAAISGSPPRPGCIGCHETAPRCCHGTWPHHGSAHRSPALRRTPRPSA